MAADRIHHRLLLAVVLLLAAFALLLQPAPAQAAVSNCTLTDSTCVWSGCRTVTASDGSTATVCTAGTTNVALGAVVDTSTSCWKYANAYQCYASTKTNTCTATQIGGCNLASSTCTKNATDGTCVAYNQTWICPDRTTTACTPSAPGGNCTITSSTCMKTVDGTCVQTAKHYTCTGTPNTSCTGAFARTLGCAKLSDTCSDYVGGVCTKETATYACNEPVTNCNTDSDCTLTISTCLAKSNGLCTSLQQNYACTKTSDTTCLQTKTTNTCTGIATYGFQNQSAKAGDHGFAQALKFHALLEAIKKNVSGVPPKIFNGHVSTCKDTIGCTFGNCCCDEGVGQGGALIWSCSKEEAQLAAARRAQATHFLGSGCSTGQSILGACICVQHEQWYCAFPSQLAKLVQEQGRAQLAAMAANGFGGATQTAIPKFPYYTTTGTPGHWLGPYDANGNDVWVWQWASACLNAGSTGSAPPAGTMCPSSFALWFVVCGGTTCQAPTRGPTLAPPTAGLAYLQVQATTTASQALTRYVVATGSCRRRSSAGGGTPPAGPLAGEANAQCAYTLSAWPGGKGGSALVRAHVDWALYGPPGWSPPVYIGNDAFEGRGLGFQAAPAVSGGTAPTSVTLRYSTDQGASWRTAALSLSLPATAGYSLPGTNLQVFGSCAGPYYQCAYQVVVPMTAMAKPWILNFNQQCGGTTLRADCSGFSVGQFALLNLGKMDLAAWAKSLIAKEPNASKMASSATTQAKMMRGNLSGVRSLTGTSTQTANGVPPAAPGQQTSPVSGGVPRTTIVLNKTQCEADAIANTCNITLTATGNWPRAYPTPGANTNPVTRLVIKWGDGTSKALSGPLSTLPPVFSASHRYARAGIWKISVRFTLNDGATYTANAQVQAWAGTPPPNQQGQAKYGGSNPILP